MPDPGCRPWSFGRAAARSTRPASSDHDRLCERRRAEPGHDPRGRFSGRKGQALFGRGPRPADAPAARPWPARLPNRDRLGNGGETATADARNRLNRRASAAQIRFGRHGRRIQARARIGRSPPASRHVPTRPQPAWRSSTRAGFVSRLDRDRTPAAAWPRARPASSCRGARRASRGRSRPGRSPGRSRP